MTTAKGTFCKVTGTIAPAISFEIDLPQNKWTRRFVQSGCGGLCGMVNASIGNASRRTPARFIRSRSLPDTAVKETRK
nr:tannase/feruloyl esterase family alpha/beta hydrolase [Acetobacter fallax]